MCFFLVPLQRSSIKGPKDAHIQKLETALFSDPKNVTLHNQLADYALSIRNYDKAYQHYQWYALQAHFWPFTIRPFPSDFPPSPLMF